jgi:hypothetical protein
MARILKYKPVVTVGAYKLTHFMHRVLYALYA